MKNTEERVWEWDLNVPEELQERIAEKIEERLEDFDLNCVDFLAGQYRDEIRLEGKTFHFECDCEIPEESDEEYFDPYVYVKRVK